MAERTNVLPLPPRQPVASPAQRAQQVLRVTARAWGVRLQERAGALPLRQAA